MTSLTDEMMDVVEEVGSLVLLLDGDNYCVGFADHCANRGYGSIEAVADFREVYCNVMGHEVRLNGSQAQTVDRWVKEYT